MSPVNAEKQLEFIPLQHYSQYTTVVSRYVEGLMMAILNRNTEQDDYTDRIFLKPKQNKS